MQDTYEVEHTANDPHRTSRAYAMKLEKELAAAREEVGALKEWLHRRRRRHAEIFLEKIVPFVCCLSFVVLALTLISAATWFFDTRHRPDVVTREIVIVCEHEEDPTSCVEFVRGN